MDKGSSITKVVVGNDFFNIRDIEEVTTGHSISGHIKLKDGKLLKIEVLARVEHEMLFKVLSTNRRYAVTLEER